MSLLGYQRQYEVLRTKSVLHSDAETRGPRLLLAIAWTSFQER